MIHLARVLSMHALPLVMQVFSLNLGSPLAALELPVLTPMHIAGAQWLPLRRQVPFCFVVAPLLSSAANLCSPLLVQR